MRVLLRALARVPVIVLAAAVGIAQAKPNIPFHVTSEPSGATVKLVRDGGEVIATGITPWDTAVPNNWSHPGVVKKLFEPLQIVISKEGYVTRTYTITDMNPLVDRSTDDILGSYLLRSDNWHVNLYKPVDFYLSSSAQGQAKQRVSPPLGSSASTFVTADSLQAVAAHAKPALVLIHAGTAYGTGFFVTDNGVIVTSRGLIGQNTVVTVTTDRGDTVRSDCIYVSPDRDIALIKVAGSGYPHLRLSGASSMALGEPVIALGSPLMPLSGQGIAIAGINHVAEPLGVSFSTIGSPTVCVGAVRALGGTKAEGWLLQADATIYWGNTGGPLLNLHGEVLGVNTTDIVAIVTPKDNLMDRCDHCWWYNSSENRLANRPGPVDVPILNDLSAGPGLETLTFVDTGGRPFEQDDARQTVNRSLGFAMASSTVVEMLKARFNVAQESAVQGIGDHHSIADRHAIR